MAKTSLTGTITRIKSGRIYETFELRLSGTNAARVAFEKRPEGALTQFLKSKGFKVNSIRVIKRRKQTRALRRNIDIVGARHAHSGRSKSGWV
jgi:hypothetical protein